MNTSISRKATLIGAALVMAVVAALTLQPSKANAATGTILAGATITVGTIVTTLQSDIVFDDTVLPWSGAGFFNSMNGGTDVEILSDSITYVAGLDGTFAMTGNLLIELLTAIGNCTILILTPNGVTLSLLGRTNFLFRFVLSTYTYQLDACGALLTAAVNGALLGPSAPLNPITILFLIM